VSLIVKIVLPNSSDKFYLVKYERYTVKTKYLFKGDQYPVLGVKLYRKSCIFWLFFKIGLCSSSAISFERS